MAAGSTLVGAAPAGALLPTIEKNYISHYYHGPVAPSTVLRKAPIAPK